VADANGEFVVQVGSFTRKSTAQDICQRLNNAGYPTAIAVKIDNAKQFFRIWVGPFASKEKAKTVGQQLKASEDLDYFILTK
jgi:cell division septation protein DedD